MGGGAAVLVGDIVGPPMGMSWADDGFIYVGGSNNEFNTISRLPETGGTTEVVVEIADPDALVYGPRLLPGNDWLLFTLAPRLSD